MQEPSPQRIQALFITHPRSHLHLQNHYDVTLVDNTYSTNRFGMYLMVTIGIDNCGNSFFISFAFLSDQTEESYKWALSCNKELFANLNTPIVIMGPEAIATDCDQALRNAISKVFPDSPAFLCAWHANKNIQQHCSLCFLLRKTGKIF